MEQKEFEVVDAARRRDDSFKNYRICVNAAIYDLEIRAEQLGDPLLAQSYMKLAENLTNALDEHDIQIDIQFHRWTAELDF